MGNGDQGPEFRLHPQSARGGDSPGTFRPGIGRLQSLHECLSAAHSQSRAGMEWLLKSVIPRLQWPKPVFKAKRAIMADEHAAIVAREQNAERRDFYELLWHTGASQLDGACLLAEDVAWNSRTISYSRAKLKSRGGIDIKPALIRFGAEIEVILKRRPGVGPLFP